MLKSAVKMRVKEKERLKGVLLKKHSVVDKEFGSKYFYTVVFHTPC